MEMIMNREQNETKELKLENLFARRKLINQMEKMVQNEILLNLKITQAFHLCAVIIKMVKIYCVLYVRKELKTSHSLSDIFFLNNNPVWMNIIVLLVLQVRKLKFDEE